MLVGECLNKVVLRYELELFFEMSIAVLATAITSRHTRIFQHRRSFPGSGQDANQVWRTNPASITGVCETG